MWDGHRCAPFTHETRRLSDGHVDGATVAWRRADAIYANLKSRKLQKQTLSQHQLLFELFFLFATFLIFHGPFVVGLLIFQGFAVRVEHFEEGDIAHRPLDLFNFRLHYLHSSYCCPYVGIFLLDPEHEPLPNIFGPYVVAGGVVLDGHILQHQS